eukprot:CAMPEP_0117018282 /NCGR_PEP_ID=MMETSP0472-20121206/14161_1 /TAXON_ID=693140 ORGANISM="Tiarina fusus, Strain LIS" /NCGR_SAMPLE_ID=MMETSP0472 /ASSEMBLY_ACC=CAM_ASM_000603 /LENGTH=82 /DNA_ID=CAMNT_0004722893 /DNA_START=343 /DNA_END=588 /DNA_ORIENTATION=-
MSDAPPRQGKHQRSGGQEDAVESAGSTGAEAFVDGVDGVGVLISCQEAVEFDVVGVGFEFEIKAALDLALGDDDAVGVVDHE